MGNDMAVYGAGRNLQGGQYKMMMDRSFDHLCDILYLEQNRVFFENYQAHTKQPVAWKTCPYPAGTNEVKNFLVEDNGNYLPPYVPGGEKWKIEMRFLKNGIVLGGYNMYGILRNLNSLVGGHLEGKEIFGT